MATVGSAPTTQAGQAWHHAMKVRKHLLKQLEKVQADGSGGVDLAQFEKIDSLLEALRLACVQTIFLDFEYAAEEKTENVLWTLHTMVNSEYRRTGGKLKGNAHAVEKRKVDKMYQNFLRIAQKFYKTYVQRLTARYDIQELKRIANGIEVDQRGADDMISPVPEKLQRLVLRSCHATLIRLGDLTRYRVAAKYRKSGGFDSALTFYALAQDLLPKSGFGHHQMGIIQLDEGNQLDVVYHFYRAWATAEPHPNAKGNLESKLKDLRAPNTPAPRHVSATPRDTFSMWFIKLHAFFYKGEAFSQHAELEGEVIHRLDMMAKSSDSGPLLMKTILINIAAFHIASARFADTNKDSALKFARFTMGLNARFLAVLSDVSGAELARHAFAKHSESESCQKDQLPPVFSHLLPMLRVYMVWLASRRREIFSTPEATGGLIPAMLQSLGRVLTLLCAEATEHGGLASSSYLLWEDLEMRGLQPLEPSQVPEACRCYCDEAGQVKPRQEPQADPRNRHLESLARLLDILRIAYFLAEDKDVPLAYRIVEDKLVFEYQVNQPLAPAQANATTTEASTLALDPPAPALTQPPPSVSTQEGAAAQTGTGNGRTNLSIEPVWSDFPSGDDETNDRTENTVMSMLMPFLKPPTPQPAGQVSALTEPSYGLHSETAEELFASVAAQRSPGGTVHPTTFEQLPWDWLHTPTPQKGDRESQETFSGQPNESNNSHGSRRMNGLRNDPMLSPLAHRTPSAPQQIRPASALRSPFAPSAEDTHRNQLLQSFSGSGSAPRTSSFSHWSPDHDASRPRQTSSGSPWAAQAFGAAPMSSNVSAFSHPSSLYQGTPANSLPAGAAGATGEPSGLPSSNSWQGPVPSDRQLRVDNTTSNYDAAIFDAAFKD